MAVTFEQMKGAVGSLLFLWSHVERELKASLKALNDDRLPRPAHGIARTIELWSQDLQRRAGPNRLHAELSDRTCACLREALRVRNLVCHGLIGFSADYPAAENEAHLSVELGDETRRISWDELQTLFAQLESARWVIRDLTAAALGDEEGRHELLQQWNDFPQRR